MTCYSPIQAYSRPDYLTEKGKKKILFHLSDAELVNYDRFGIESLKLPCGQCVGCRLERSRQWAIRCIHESQLHEKNSFITLTYDDDHLPKGGDICVTVLQKFLKRLRKQLYKDYGIFIRFFACGEYGERYGRPHYHACIFGFDFPDRTLLKVVNGIKLFDSQYLRKIWGFGNVSVGEVTFDSAAYVARYIMTKINGDLAFDHYLDKETGLLKNPEFVTMSRKPGIGKGWFDQFKSDVYPSDIAVIYKDGKSIKCRPPKYYDSQFELIDADYIKDIKKKRVASMEKYSGDQTRERLKVRMKVLLSKLQRLVRNVE